MRVISFCLNGKMAHFRKYYSNSTALSHIVPPVTTIKGILAGILGYERDEYYEEFANCKCKVALKIKNPLKKVTQTMNLLKVESLNHLNGAGLNRTQNHTEFIIPKDIRTGNICYEVVFYHKDEKIMKALEEKLCQKSNVYLSEMISIALGSAQCLGWISNGKVVELAEKSSEDNIINIYSAVVVNSIEKISLENNDSVNFFKEETVTEFTANRLITEKSRIDILLNLNDKPLALILKENTKYFLMNNEENIMFLE